MKNFYKTGFFLLIAFNTILASFLLIGMNRTPDEIRAKQFTLVDEKNKVLGYITTNAEGGCLVLRDKDDITTVSKLSATQLGVTNKITKEFTKIIPYPDSRD